MTKYITALALLMTLSAAAESEDTNRPSPFYPVTTYSIVCYDSATGQFGAAVQSHWFKVADVIWAEPEVGVVATQSLADFSYGLLGLEMMEAGKTAQQALEGLKSSDPNSDVRQVAMIDNKGNIATHTGENCIAMAGHRVGPNYSVQANLMEKATVWDAMAQAFEKTEGELADRMMAALEAAQAEGGDIRGKQSAAMLVVTGEPTGMPWTDRIVDLRVDDSPEPLQELKRLISINRAYDYMNLGDEYFAKGEIEKAKEAYSKSAKLAPGNAEILFWQAATMVSAGEEDTAMTIFKKVFEMDENWRILVPRLVDSGLLPDDPELIERIVAQ